MSEHPAYGVVRPVTPFASVVLASNPNVMTLDGTNTWTVGAEDASSRIVIDPGPADDDHLKLVAEQGEVELILLTHHHSDHTEGAREFAALVGAPVRAWDQELCLDAKALRDDEVIAAAGVELRVLAVPGHTADSVSFAIDHGGVAAVFTGDTILGRGTTVVAHPDGHLGSYLASLERLARYPSGTVALTGHGPELPDVSEAARAYLKHREQRLDQVRDVVREQGLDVTPMRVVEIVYADVDRAVWPAAESSVRAQLEYLREQAES